MNWFLYDNSLRHERVKQKMKRRQYCKNLYTKNFAYTKNFLVLKIAAVNFSKNLLPEKHKQLRFKSRLKKSLPRKYQQIIW